MEVIPSEEQINYWESRTGVLFDNFDVGPSSIVQVQCPKCLTLVESCWSNPENTGYGQAGFSIPCAHCGLNISRESMCVGKLVRDLVNPQAVLA